jgi:hypothetical protein
MAYMRKGRYWYKSRREGQRVVSEYIGCGDTGQLCAQFENQQAQERARERSEWRAFVTQEHELDGQLDAVAAQLRGLVETALTVSGYHKHSGTWRRARACL